MTLSLVIVFWLTSLLVVYPYIIYPPLLRFLARRTLKRSNETTTGHDVPLRVTLIISAYNEETIIAQKLKNALKIDFPTELLEIIVVSDASSDRTDQIVDEFAAREPCIRLIRQNERRGKSAGLNKGVVAARGDILVFTDANTMYESNAISELVGGFANPFVGYVVGAAHYYDTKGNRAGESESLYWKLEMSLKRLESDYSSVVGGDGAIYAIRRHLFWELKDDDISDFVNPLQIVAAGYWGLFNPAARCYEHTGETFDKEFRRKRRIVNRTWRAVRRYSNRLNFKEHGRFLFMLLSHKVIRWFALPLIAMAWVTNTALLGKSELYTLTWLAITSSAVVAGYGAMLDYLGRPQTRLVSILYYFYFTNLAGLLGIWDEYRGIRHATWDHIRKTKT